jgi:hypothetical protein
MGSMSDVLSSKNWQVNYFGRFFFDAETCAKNGNFRDIANLLEQGEEKWDNVHEIFRSQIENLIFRHRLDLLEKMLAERIDPTLEDPKSLFTQRDNEDWNGYNDRSTNYGSIIHADGFWSSFEPDFLEASQSLIAQMPQIEDMPKTATANPKAVDQSPKLNADETFRV